MSNDPQTPDYRIRRLSNPPPLKRQLVKEYSNYGAGEFIKPDSAFTRFETRQYILSELAACLKERLVSQENMNSTDESHLTYRSNPHERLYYVAQMLEELNIEKPAGQIAFEVLEKYLKREQIDFDVYPVKLVHLVMGFIHTDRLPNERTIFSYWNHSPFHALRDAPPLTDEDFEQVEKVEEKTTDDVITIQISFTSLLTVLAFVTVWIAITVVQLIPVRSYESCLRR